MSATMGSAIGTLIWIGLLAVPVFIVAVLAGGRSRKGGIPLWLAVTIALAGGALLVAGGHGW